MTTAAKAIRKYRKRRTALCSLHMAKDIPRFTAVRCGLAVQPRRGLGARHLALGARFGAVAGAGEDLEVGDGVELGDRAAVLGQVEDQAVEAGGEAAVEDLRPRPGRVAAGAADSLGEDAVGPGVAGEVEGGADEAAVADRAVDRVQELDRVDAVGNAVEAEADVALAELRRAAELARRQVEVVDDRLDDDRVAGLTSTVAGGDDLYAGFARHRCRARLGVLGVRATPEDQSQCQQDRGRRQRCQGCIPPTHRSEKITRKTQIPMRRTAVAALAMVLALAGAAPAALAGDLAGRVNPFA